MMRDSESVGNTNAGIFSTKSGALTIRTMVDRSLLGNNGTGALSDGAGCVVTMTGSTVAGNITGLSATNGGFLLS